ncbi:MAG: hypothetical protein ACJA0E_001887 [Bermanella sp.]|jgi:uncharacterized protein YhhL (DUF1145 family)
MKIFNKLNLAALYAFWIAFVVNIIMPFPEGWSTGVMYIGLGLLVVHLIEFIIVFKKLKAVGHTSAKDFALVLLVGLFHWMPLIRKAG